MHLAGVRTAAGDGFDRSGVSKLKGGEMKFISLQENASAALLPSNPSRRVWVNVEAILEFHKMDNATSIRLSNLGNIYVVEDPAEILEKIKEAK
jgi:uncharacterized protein YlzI (FlbEa/FlbD family)